VRGQGGVRERRGNDEVWKSLQRNKQIRRVEREKEIKSSSAVCKAELVCTECVCGVKAKQQGQALRVVCSFSAVCIVSAVLPTLPHYHISTINITYPPESTALHYRTALYLLHTPARGRTMGRHRYWSSWRKWQLLHFLCWKGVACHQGCKSHREPGGFRIRGGRGRGRSARGG
jgi:hypothetical protein